MMAYKVLWLWENVIRYKKKGEFVEWNKSLLSTRMQSNRNKKNQLKVIHVSQKLFCILYWFHIEFSMQLVFLYGHKNIAAILCMVWHCRLSCLWTQLVLVQSLLFLFISDIILFSGGGLGGTRKGGPDENTRFSGRDDFR